MSGGHYDYKYSPVQEMAEQIRNEAENWRQGGEIPCPECNGTRMVKRKTCLNCFKTPLGQPGRVYVEGSSFPKEQIPDRKKIQAILTQTANAMKALEWYDSSDASDWDAVLTAFEKILENQLKKKYETDSLRKSCITIILPSENCPSCGRGDNLHFGFSNDKYVGKCENCGAKQKSLDGKIWEKDNS